MERRELQKYARLINVHERVGLDSSVLARAVGILRDLELTYAHIHGEVEYSLTSFEDARRRRAAILRAAYETSKEWTHRARNATGRDMTTGEIVSFQNPEEIIVTRALERYLEERMRRLGESTDEVQS
ncbi:MAG: hypothetical protein HYW25_03675 [Candidatus Aenigmarchaeota archaeon]|nr:hypothetical protein [Candidatus Aenigmarchaeota archaeon]